MSKTIALLTRCRRWYAWACLIVFHACLLLVIALGWRPLGSLDSISFRAHWTAPAKPRASDDEQVQLPPAEPRPALKRAPAPTDQLEP